jgi:lysophospholipase L1-like esterase
MGGGVRDLSAWISWRRAAVVCVSAWLGACGGSPTEPTRPPGLTMTCPVNQSVQSSDGNPAGVSFDPPQTVGGRAPVTTTCAPASGSQFPVGSSTVTCQAADAASQQTSCTFTIVVQGPPRLTATRFLAFGDSLTAGVLSPSPTFLIVSPPTSYPFQLQNRLVARYRTQSPVVLNEGNAGELASGTGVQRFRSVLLAARPDVVLLMEGTNDLLFGQTGADNAINAIAAMIREAKSQSVRIALSTIPPQRAGGLRHRDAVVRLIPGFNDRIRALAGAEGIPLVEVFNGLQGDNTLIGIDDLHMTERGYDAMAGIYFDAINANFEAQAAANGFRR